LPTTSPWSSVELHSPRKRPRWRPFHLELIKEADAIIDLGPEGGAGGGQLVAAGSPPELLKFTWVPHTAKCLKGYLAKT
jgi:hypothetical protein